MKKILLFVVVLFLFIGGCGYGDYWDSAGSTYESDYFSNFKEACRAEEMRSMRNRLDEMERRIQEKESDEAFEKMFGHLNKK